MSGKTLNNRLFFDILRRKDPFWLQIEDTLRIGNIITRKIP
jgi:hypothetical protein